MLAAFILHKKCDSMPLTTNKEDDIQFAIVTDEKDISPRTGLRVYCGTGIKSETVAPASVGQSICELVMNVERYYKYKDYVTKLSDYIFRRYSSPEETQEGFAFITLLSAMVRTPLDFDTIESQERFAITYHIIKMEEILTHINNNSYRNGNTLFLNYPGVFLEEFMIDLKGAGTEIKRFVSYMKVNDTYKLWITFFEQPDYEDVIMVSPFAGIMTISEKQFKKLFYEADSTEE